jgi:hypothetical protein
VWIPAWMVAAVLVTALLGGSTSASLAQEQVLGPQLSIAQAQLWCFQSGQPGCQGEWLQLQSDRVQFSSSRCDATFILPAVARQNGPGNRTPAVVVVDSAPQELLASARRSGNLRVLADICMIELEAS